LFILVNATVKILVNMTVIAAKIGANKSDAI
jgi:hypothetical protein